MTGYAELALWQTKPDHAIVYVVDGHATTWLGADLGSVEVTAQHVRRGKYGEPYRMEYIRLLATNGATYHGKYGSDWSQACRVHKTKGVK